MESTIYPELYSRNSDGSIQVWQIEVLENKFRTICGRLGGEQVVSAWTVAVGKNSGKANATTDEEQAHAEAISKWKKKLKSEGYFEDKAHVDNQSRFVEPMLAYPLIQKKTDKKLKKTIVVDNSHRVKLPAMLDRKYNGQRMLRTLLGGTSRKGEPINSCPHIIETTSELFEKHPDLVLDGELYNHELRHRLNDLISITRTTVAITPELLQKSKEIVRYYVYDGYGFNGIKKETGNKDRRDALQDLLKDIPFVVVVPYAIVNSMDEAKSLYQGYVEDGYEGGIIRSIHAPYQNKRTWDLIKLKPYEDMEVTIVEIIDPISGNWGGTGKTALVRMENGKKFTATFKGDYETAKQILQEQDKWIGKKVTMTYNGWTGKMTPNYGQIDPYNCDVGDR